MRQAQASARPSKPKSLYFPFASIPQTVLDALRETPSNRKDASHIGADAALAFVEALHAKPHCAGWGLLPLIAKHFEDSGCAPAIAIGFFNQVDKLLLRGARVDAQSARNVIRSVRPVRKAEKEAHGPRSRA